ncbi:hypothetical protein TSUD_292880 [Trifolium subterraneum]|uniref:Integrase catalytic domain-containing protein n=1 Tax=Trifolium subterraneum TaxID=3900 RepID=A0A2Z6MUF0_TRISU|nr:hypothetical protein TSUD_292880 [Trifolium subterraneum]
MNEEGEIISLEAQESEEEEEVEAECKLIGVLGKMGEYNTMKLEGKVMNVEVEVLIDSGASHSFISPELTTALGFVVDALVLGLGGLDIVMGVSWLSTLGKVVMDWKDLTMQFVHNNKVVTLQGGRQFSNGYLNSFLEGKDEMRNDVAWWAQLEHMGNCVEVDQNDIAEVLKHCPEVFKEKISLPPIRDQVHRINLLPNQGPINVRPYKYPHHQKTEIEQRVHDLLNAGVIRPSFSAFSSPVILVKKKDHSWRMCVDYRALNKVTIPDKYPIPVVDELLDELHGSTIFSKIDLKSGYHQIRVHESDIDKTAFRTHNGVSVDPEKIDCIMKWPKPKTVKGVRGFLGLTGYYRKFVKDYGKIAKPLTELTKKDNFIWGESAQQAFDQLKTIMTSSPVLTLPNFAETFEIECDAAGRGIGAVLMKHKQPIAYEKELMALVFSIQHWRHYLLGREFVFEVRYKPGPENKAVDALSRCLDEGELSALVSNPIWVDRDKILDEIKEDQGVQKLLAELLKEFHETPMGGHSSYLRTYRRLAENLYWVGMQRTVREYVRSCDICQRHKYEATTPGGLLQPLPIPNAVWEDISMDFITGLPKSRGFEAILVIVDRLSKYSHFVLLKHPYAAKTIAEIFVREVVRLHGIPNSIVSARDPAFVSHFWRELFKMQEVINRCLEGYLRCFAIDQPKSWSIWLPWAEYWYNTTYHISIGKSPFEVVYGRQPPKLLRFLPNETKVAAVAIELKDKDEALNQLKLHLLKAQQQMQAYANQKRRDLKFEVNEWVFLKLRPHRQQSVIRRVNQKLAARFWGPFKIIEKKVVGDYHAQGDLPKELDMVLDEEIYPIGVLGSRVIMKEGSSVNQSLIQWKNKSLEDVTWEDDPMIRGQFPDFNLEDKILSKAGGIDRNEDQVNIEVGPEPKVWRVYKRWNGMKASVSDVDKRNT